MCGRIVLKKHLMKVRFFPSTSAKLFNSSDKLSFKRCLKLLRTELDLSSDTHDLVFMNLSLQNFPSPPMTETHIVNKILKGT
jgi:hypothetical protein